MSKEIEPVDVNEECPAEGGATHYFADLGHVTRAQEWRARRKPIDARASRLAAEIGVPPEKTAKK